MRKIEVEMLRAIANGDAMHKQNTTVGCSGIVYLHGNHIATCHDDGTITVNTSVLRHWPTPTTKSRLRALGVNVYTEKGITYVDGQDINGPIPCFYRTTRDNLEYIKNIYGIGGRNENRQ